VGTAFWPDSAWLAGLVDRAFVDEAAAEVKVALKGRIDLPMGTRNSDEGA
jgi:hypothetical protein